MERWRVILPPHPRSNAWLLWWHINYLFINHVCGCSEYNFWWPDDDIHLWSIVLWMYEEEFCWESPLSYIICVCTRSFWFVMILWCNCVIVKQRTLVALHTSCTWVLYRLACTQIHDIVMAIRGLLNKILCYNLNDINVALFVVKMHQKSDDQTMWILMMQKEKCTNKM